MVDNVHDILTASAAVGFDRGRRRFVIAFGIGYFGLCHVAAPVLHFARTPGVPYWQDPVTLLCHTLGFVALSAVYLGKDSTTRLAHVLVWATWVAVWVVVLRSIGSPHVSAVTMFLAAGPLLAGSLLSTRHVVAAGALNVLGAAAMGAAGMVPASAALHASLLTAAATLVLGITSYTRHVDEAIIGGQARQLLTRTAELEAIMEASPEGLIALDAGGRIVDANGTAARLVGSRRLLRGAPLDRVLHGDVAGVLEDLVHSDGTDLRRIDLPGGRVARVSIRAIRGPREGHLIMLADITDELRADEERRQADVRRSEVEKLQEVTRFKSNLLNAASHELNTPLTPVRLQMELLRSPDRGPLTDKQRHSLDILDRNIQRLSHLITDILDVAKLDGARLPLRCAPVALEDILRDEVAAFQPAAARRGLRLDVDVQGRGVVWGDPGRLGQVVGNLIGNAVKFTNDGHVRARLALDDAWVTVSVEDTGVGVPLGSDAQLFEPFSQLHQVGRDAVGAGMGLYLSKGIIEAHGGSMGFERHPEGSRFWFRIPLEDAAPAGAARTTVAHAS